MKKILIGAVLLVLIPMLMFQIGYSFFSLSMNGSDSMGAQYVDKWLFTNPFSTPHIGDWMGFICLSKEKCGESYGYEIDHRWVSTDPDGCMHIVGDNPKYDWSAAKCLYPSEIKVLGITHVLF